MGIKLNKMGIATDVAKNFRFITGIDPLLIIDPETGEFDQELIDESFPSIEKYLITNYDFDIWTDEDVLYEIDNQLLRLYS